MCASEGMEESSEKVVTSLPQRVVGNRERVAWREIFFGDFSTTPLALRGYVA
jgi:hypothetical protein